MSRGSGSGSGGRAGRRGGVRGGAPGVEKGLGRTGLARESCGAGGPVYGLAESHSGVPRTGAGERGDRRLRDIIVPRAAVNTKLLGNLAPGAKPLLSSTFRPARILISTHQSMIMFEFD